MMIVKGKQYRTNLPNTMRIAALREVKREFGMKWSEIRKAVGELALNGAPLADLLAEDEFLAWIYAWLLTAGEQITRADLEALTVDDIDFTTTDGPDTPPVKMPDEPPDPTQASVPTDSAPAAGAARSAKKRRSNSTTTSKPRSKRG